MVDVILKDPLQIVWGYYVEGPTTAHLKLLSMVRSGCQKSTFTLRLKATSEFEVVMEKLQDFRESHSTSQSTISSI